MGDDWVVLRRRVGNLLASLRSNPEETPGQRARASREWVELCEARYDLLQLAKAEGRTVPDRLLRHHVYSPPKGDDVQC